MNTSWTEVLGKLRADSGYLAAFARTYGNGITRENVLDALSAFHRSLITPNARFDQYLRGRDNAITAARSEEHTSELQSLMRISYAVFCLKKKTTTKQLTHHNTTQLEKK